MTDEPSDHPDRGFRPRFNYVQPDGSKGRSFVLTPEGAFAYERGKVTTIADAVDFGDHAVQQFGKFFLGQLPGWAGQDVVHADAGGGVLDGGLLG